MQDTINIFVLYKLSEKKRSNYFFLIFLIAVTDIKRTKPIRDTPAITNNHVIFLRYHTYMRNFKKLDK